MLSAERLRCEYLKDPLGVDVAEPRFSWILTPLTLEGNAPADRGEQQSAYQVLVASDPDVLQGNIGDIWDSGVVDSDRCAHIAYKGAALASGRRYYWKVRVFDRRRRSSRWSSTATFVTGLLSESDWQAHWIGAADSRISSPLIRKELCVHGEVREAYAFICGLGYYELYLNGRRIGDKVLDPATTEYSSRVLYSTYDVTMALKAGSNAIGVMLGNGWFTPPWRGAKRYGDRPQLIVQLFIRFADGTTRTIVSDDTWKTIDGPVRYNSIFDGEVYDARLERRGWSCPGYADAEWSNAAILPGPGGVLDSQLMPAIQVTKTIQPVSISNPRPGVYVYDMGQNFAGWSRLRIRQAADGTQIALKYAERIGDDGLIDQRSLRNAKATDTYIARGDGEQVYEPRFTYHGFRYVQVEGYPTSPTLSDLQGRVVHTALEQTGYFRCSNPLVNRVHENTWWSYVSNLHGIPTDCPQRDERLGWTGDAHLAAELGMTNFFSAPFYVKWLEDAADAQSRTKSRGVPDLVPFHLAGHEVYPPGPPGWSVAYLLIAWYMHRYFGDSRVLEQHYEGVRSWVDCVREQCDDNYIVSWARGDWAIPSTYEADEESKKVTSTSLLYMGATILSEMAHELGYAADASKYSELATKVRDGFCEHLMDQNTGMCGSGTQTSNLFPLYAGVVPEDRVADVLERAVESIKVRDYHLDTGILGTKALVNVLPEHGMIGLLHRMVTQMTYPSYGYMVANGATTLWETFDGGINRQVVPSLNHIMFGTVDEYFFNDLAGIKPPTAPGTSVGYSVVTIEPQIPDDPELTWVDASVTTPRGVLQSAWEKREDRLTMKVAVPVGSRALVHVPLPPQAPLMQSTADDPKSQSRSALPIHVVIFEGDRVIYGSQGFVRGVEGVENAYRRGDCIVVEIASGSYTFTLMHGLDSSEIGGLPRPSRSEMRGEQLVVKLEGVGVSGA